MSLRHDVAVRAVIRRRIAAPRERVFQAWTKAEHLQRWFFPSVNGDAVPYVEVDLRVGGRYRIAMHTPAGDITAMVGGTYYEVHPPERLVFSWTWEAPQPDPSETVVTVELHELQGETEVVITHEHPAEPAAQEQHRIGWNCCLERLTHLLDERALGGLTGAADPCRA
jgi:uncharacterized protein YndB with AHSA1/START domain